MRRTFVVSAESVQKVNLQETYQVEYQKAVATTINSDVTIMGKYKLVKNLVMCVNHADLTKS
jgi:hypothetical protein